MRSTRAAAAWSAMAIATSLLSVALVSAQPRSASTSKDHLVSTAVQASLADPPAGAARALVNPAPASISNSRH